VTAPNARSSGNINRQHQVGAICETIATEYFFQRGYFVFHPWFGIGPVDLICIKANPPEVLLLDVKADNRRLMKGRNVPTRITRILTKHQKRLGVSICYVNPDTREVHMARHDRAKQCL
jgi:hypothetical protein